jgi:catechol 2,3-dioxygenase-like lactoylglutathione lyase family enzyme
MQPRIHLITLGVRDLAKSAVFYEKLFGVTRSPQSQEAVVFLKLNGIALSLFGLDALAADAQVKNDAGSYHGFSLAHNAKSEPEVDSLYKEAIALGARELKKPEKAFWGGYSGYVADPDGNLIEIAYNPFFPFNAAGELDI